MNTNYSLFTFGFGYTAHALAKQALLKHWHVAGTSRNVHTRDAMNAMGYELVDFDLHAASEPLHRTTHLLISTPLLPNWDDPVLMQFQNLICYQMPQLRWIGYLSTTGVYGDHQGAWIDENTRPEPSSPRASGRLRAEAAWLSLGKSLNVPTQIFRLAGIYGPGRNALQQLREGTARPVYKKDQVFSRIHVSDIATILMAAMQRPPISGVYNVCDDEPAPAHEVIAYAAELLHLPMPKMVAIEDATLSDMAREFYQNNRRVKNDKVKEALEITLSYPTYREGLRALLERGDY